MRVLNVEGGMVNANELTGSAAVEREQDIGRGEQEEGGGHATLVKRWPESPEWQLRAPDHNFHLENRAKRRLDPSLNSIGIRRTSGCLCSG